MQINKTDQNDAEGLAQIVRAGWYRSVHVKSFESHRARALLGARTQLIGMTTRLSNHIRGAQNIWSSARRDAGQTQAGDPLLAYDHGGIEALKPKPKRASKAFSSSKVMSSRS
jgi:transposase